jgi:hypothetical protein
LRDVFIVHLLRQRDHRRLIAHLDLQRPTLRADRERAIAQTPHEVERLARRLLARQAQRVRRHVRLDHLPHLQRRPEEPVRRRHPIQRLVRPLEVVVLHE